MELEKIVQSIDADVGGLLDGIGKAGKATDGLVTKLGNIGKVAATAVAGLAATGVGALTAAITTSISKTTEWAGEMDSIQDILGGTKEQAAGLALMMKRVGGNTEQVTGAIKKMAQGLNSLDKNGVSKTQKSLKKLGIEINDTNGEMKDSYEIFREVADVVSKMPDGLEKDAYLMDIFGKSGAELGDALNAAANGGMKNFEDEAVRLGLAIDPQRTIDFQMAQEKLKDTFNGLWVSLGNKLMPSLTTFLNWFTEFMQSPAVQNFINPVIDSIGKAVDAFVTGAEKGGIFQGVLDGLRSFNSPILTGIADTIETIKIKIGEFVTTITTDFGEGSIIGNALAILATAWEIVKTTVVELWEVLTGQTDPAMKEMGKVTAPDLAKVLHDINEELLKFLGWVKDISPETWKLIAALTTFFIVGTPIINLLSKFSFWLKLLIWDAGVGASVAKVLAAAIAAIGGPVVALIGAIVALALAIVFLGDDAWRTFRMIGDIILFTIGKIVADVLRGFRDGLSSVSGAIQGVINWVYNLKNALANLSIPSWLKPGSPPPLYFALKDIQKAMKDVATTALPQFNAELNLGGSFEGFIENRTPAAVAETIDYYKLATIIGTTVAQAVA